MTNDLKIKIAKFLYDDQYINDDIILKPTSSFSPWKENDFHWEGYYKEDKLTVLLKRNTSAEFAEITNPTNLNIENQIVEELERVLKQLN